MSLFTSIGDTLNASSWFQLIHWPFWTFLFILALCGIHTAHYGKGNLLSLGFRGALKLALIYMAALAGYVWMPDFMARVSPLPFFSVTKEAVTLVNPLSLLDKWDTTLPRVLVQLYFLLFFINAVSVFEYTTPNFIGWLFFQGLFCLIAVGFYAAISTFIISYWPFSLNTLYSSAAILLCLIFGVILAFKIYFVFIAPGNSNKLKPVYDFLTTQKFGSLFTVTALSFVIVLAYLFIATLFGQAHMAFGSFNSIAFALNSIMSTLTLYVFCRYYCLK